MAIAAYGGSKAYAWFEVQSALRARVAAADEVIRKQSYLTDEKRAKLNGLPQVNDTNYITGLSQEGKRKAALPDQQASLSGQGTSSGNTSGGAPHR